MFRIDATPEFIDWSGALDKSTLRRIDLRLKKLERGLWGDWKRVQGTTLNVRELREDFGPGYRIYVTERGQDIVVLLAGGTKKSQTADIALAIMLAEGL